MMRTATLLATCAVAAAPVLGLAATQSDPKAYDLTDEDRKHLAEHFGNDITVKAIPAGTIDKPGAYLALEHGTTWTYKVTSGKRRGQTATAKVVKTTGDDPTSVWRFDTGGNSIMHLHPADAGGFEMPATEDRKQKVISKYQPAEPGLLAGLEPGQSKTMKIAVGVYDAANPDHESHKGSLDCTYTYVGAFEVTVPAGTYETVLLRWQYKGKVGPANVEDVQYWFLAKDRGVVAMIEKSDVSAVLVYQDHEKHAAVLAEDSAR